MVLVFLWGMHWERRGKPSFCHDEVTEPTVGHFAQGQMGHTATTLVETIQETTRGITPVETIREITLGITPVATTHRMGLGM